MNGRRAGADGVTALCSFIVLLFALPSAFVIGPLGSIGVPAVLVGLAAFVWWVWHHLNRWELRQIGPQPVRWAMFILLAVILISYVHAMASPIARDEISPADAAMLRIVALLGIALVANDGVRTTGRMETLLRCLIVMVSISAALSIVQFVTGEVWTDRISIPGLTQVSSLGLDERQNIIRPSGTAGHPIEFAAVLSMVLPIAIMYAKSRGKARLSALLPVILIGIGVALSLSRTAILCVAIGLMLIIPALPRLWRVWGIVGGIFMMGVFYVTVPGFVGTTRGLFVGFSGDPSVQSRVGSYETVMEFVRREPWFGRGLGTFLPRYWILDNMYLQFLIEVGLLGLAALLGVFAVAFFSGWRARRTLPTSADRDLAAGVAAGAAAGAISFAMFDAISFPQAAFCLFLLVGCCGAYWRLAEPGRLPSAARAAASLSLMPRRRSGS